MLYSFRYKSSLLFLYIRNKLIYDLQRRLTRKDTHPDASHEAGVYECVTYITNKGFLKPNVIDKILNLELQK
jgi:hypothetical protein